MHQQLKVPTTGVTRASQRLVEEYRPKRLHSLRIGIRRIRSILKQIGSHRARRFRKSWGGFAAVTNNARDWDVFLKTASRLLSATEFAEFERLNQAHVQSSHEAVAEMLQSIHWHHYMEEWSSYIQLSANDAAGIELSVSTLNFALAKARRMLAKALVDDDDRSWHKFRIAVKDARYVADACTADSENTQYLASVISECKSLQTLLGKWHDATIQLHMLDGLETADVHVSLASVIERRKQRFVSKIRARLTDEWDQSKNS